MKLLGQSQRMFEEPFWGLTDDQRVEPEALGVLLCHLESEKYPDRVVEGLGLVMQAKRTAIYWGRLKRLYLNTTSPQMMQAVAQVLASCATKTQLADIYEFLSQEDRGTSRVPIVSVVLRFGGAHGEAAIDKLRNHPELGKEATVLLEGRIRRQHHWFGKGRERQQDEGMEG